MSKETKQRLIDDINRALDSDGDWATLAERFESVLEDCLEYLTEGTVERYEPMDDDDIEIITQEKAEEIWDSVEIVGTLGAYEPRGSFMYQDEKGVYVAIDNTTGDAWTEAFYSEDIARAWLRGELDTEEAYERDEKRVG